MNEIVKKAEETHHLTKEEIISLLETTEFDQEIFDAADRVRHEYVGDDVHLRGLIEFSNICKQNCKYCGLRRENSNVDRYKIDKEQVVLLAEAARDFGYKTVVLQSGESNLYSLEDMIYIIKEIKKLGLALTLSIGEKTTEEYRAYREAGADRYLLRIETTDKDLYAQLDPGMSFENRVRCLRDLKELDYEVGTGSMVGLPGQTVESIADDILFFQDIDADMIGIGPFIPNPDTPLKEAAGGTFNFTRKVVAIVRLLLPYINIPATTAMEAIDPNGRILTLKSGANVVMPNVTDNIHKKEYLLYPGKICLNDEPSKCIGCISGKIKSIGRTVSSHAGMSKNKSKISKA